MTGLLVFWDQKIVGTLTRHKSGKVVFQYNKEWLVSDGRSISISLPCQQEKFAPGVSTAFFENLLPESRARSILAHNHRFDKKDTFAFLNTFGEDCAGALSIIPEEKEPDFTEENGEISDKLNRTFYPNNNIIYNINNNNISYSDNVSNNNNKYKYNLLSEIKISDYTQLNPDYIEIAKSFVELFRNNLIEAGASTRNVDKAKGTCIDDIRLMIETDGYTIDDLREVYSFLKKDAFWKQNILTTSKLRKQMDKLKLKIHGEHGQTGKPGKEGTSWNELAQIVSGFK
ncbi:MAG: hypothetical protein EOM23_11125 [Candidatus Moranbacteria bacterium]|nr:hypothetical protein [Candidatus Moranbacteria bacterium]